MKFEKFFNITLDQLDREIQKDLQTPSRNKPLFESPILHEAEYFEGLNDIKTNHPFALQRIDDSTFKGVVSMRNTQYGLYQKHDGKYIWDFFIAGKKNHELMYAFVRYTVDGDVMEVKGLWQIDFVVGLVRSLIDKYYSNHFSAMRSDSIANSKGKKFFQKLANDYTQQGKQVMISIQGKETPYREQDADSYWKMSVGVHSAEKLIVYYF